MDTVHEQEHLHLMFYCSSCLHVCNVPDPFLPFPSSPPVSYTNALILNQMYSAKISEQIELTERHLRENLSRRQAVDRDIETLHMGKRPEGERRPGSRLEVTGALKKALTIFHAPYFKDVNLYTHPPNEDTVHKRQTGELDPYMVSPREWTIAEKKKLYGAVRACGGASTLFLFLVNSLHLITVNLFLSRDV